MTVSYTHLYIQRYLLTRSNVETNIYVFGNTLGGIDTVAFTGKFTEKIQTEGTVTTMMEESLDNDVDLKDVYKRQDMKCMKYVLDTETGEWVLKSKSNI